MSVTRVAATTLPTDEELAQRGAELRRLIVKAALSKALQTRNLLLVLLLTVNSMVAGVGRYRRPPRHARWAFVHRPPPRHRVYGDVTWL
jgi:hypothetical protein